MFKNGESCVVYCNEHELLKLTYDISMEHDERVDVFDCLPSKGLMATADADGLIKIWNAKKELIREIKFNEPISSVTFINVKGDLLVGHQGQLSKIVMESYNCGKRFLISKEETTEFKDTALPISETFFIEMRDKVRHSESLTVPH